MTRKEAIKIVRTATVWTDEEREALGVLIPEFSKSESEDEKIRKSLIKFLTDIKEISESGRTSWAIRKDDAEMCKSFIDYLEKQKESLRDFIDDFPYSDDSIPSDYMSDVKYEDRWHKVKDSLPNSAREVLCKDAIGNFFIGRYYKSTQSWEVVMYDDFDKSNEDNPPVIEWCEIPSEKQKKQKLNPDKEELIRHCIGLILTDATDERFKDYGLTLKDCLTWLDEQKEQKPVECIKFDNEFENQVSHLLASVLNSEYEYNAGFVKHAAQSLLGYAKNEIRSDELDKIERLMKALQATNAQIGELVEENYKLKEQKSAQSDAEKEYVRILKSIISDFVRDRMPKNTLLYQDIFDWLDGRHIEQKSDNYSEERKLNHEWTSEDWSMLCDICRYIEGTGCSSGITNQERAAWLRELPKRFSLEGKEQEPVEIDEYEIIKKHITDDVLSSEVNKRLNECGWYVTDEKPAKWSKEDEENISTLIEVVHERMGLSEKRKQYYEKWLKSLRPQQKVEWSEEDEEIFNNIIEKAKGGHWIEVNEITWLITHFKSLRPQPHTVSIKDATKFGNLEYERGVKDGIQSEKAINGSLARSRLVH